MSIWLIDYEQALGWVNEVASAHGPHLILGNGFSIAYDRDRFTYGALLAQAERDGLISELAKRFFSDLDTQDFELVIRNMSAAQIALRTLDAVKFAADIDALDEEIIRLKNALATVLAGLHPNRPYEVASARYATTREFLAPYNHIYTTNYDLLLYWTVLQTEGVVARSRVDDDGFRSRDLDGDELDCVYWDHLRPFAQSIFYLHGALHLYRGDDGLRKLTWIRTNKPLIDQIREQLASDYYPLYVSEGSSEEKLTKIHSSDYLGKGLRSLAGCGGGLTAYGLSFSNNDQHFIEAVVRSPLKRLAVGLYGDPNSEANRATVEAVGAMPSLRIAQSNRRFSELEVAFYNASTVDVW